MRRGPRHQDARCRVQRQQRLCPHRIIPQQRHRPPRHPQRKRLEGRPLRVRRGIHRPRRRHRAAMKQPQVVLHPQDAADALVEPGLRNRPLLHQLQQQLRKLQIHRNHRHVDARLDRHPHRILVVRSHLVPCVQVLHILPIRDHHPLKAQLLPQQILQHPAVRVHRDPIDLPTVHHHRHRPGRNGPLESGQEIRPQSTLRNPGLRPVLARKRLAVPQEVLHRGRHRDRPLLVAPYHGLSHVGSEQHILPERLPEPRPAGVPSDIQYGRKIPGNAHGPNLAGRVLRERAHRARVPRRRQPDLLGPEDRPRGISGTMDRVDAIQDRNPRSLFLAGDPLDFRDEPLPSFGRVRMPPAVQDAPDPPFHQGVSDLP